MKLPTTSDITRALGSKEGGGFNLEESMKQNTEFTYVANIPAGTQESIPLELAGKYREEGFTDTKDADRRLAMVIGVNLFEDIKETHEGKVKEKVDEAGKWPRQNFRLGVFGFLWKPRWRMLKEGNKQLSPATTEEVKAKYQGADESTRSQIEEVEKTAKENKNLPYGVFRDTVKNHPFTNSYIEAFQNRSQNVLVHTGDPDVVSLRPFKPDPDDIAQDALKQPFTRVAEGLFNRYDAALRKEQAAADGEIPNIISGGYQLTAATGIDPAGINKGELATIAATMLDMRLRQAMSKINPLAVYFPEPNTLFNVTEDKKQLFLDSSFGIGSSEGKHIILDMAQRKDGDLKLSLVDVEIQTGLDERFEVKAETTGKITAVESDWFVGILVPKLDQIRAILISQSQTHAHPREWANRVGAVYDIVMEKDSRGINAIHAIRESFYKKLENILYPDRSDDKWIKDTFTSAGKINTKQALSESEIRKTLTEKLRSINFDDIEVPDKKSELTEYFKRRYEGRKDMNYEVIKTRVESVMNEVPRLAKVYSETIKEFLVHGLSNP